MWISCVLWIQSPLYRTLRLCFVFYRFLRLHFEKYLLIWQVVPPDQARKIHQALKQKGLPVALVEYEGEQHGFRKV